MSDCMAQYRKVPIDVHSHILPSMDDGSQNVRQSLAMLESAKQLCTPFMVATPHFYPENEDPTVFLKRRSESIQALLDGGYDPLIHPRLFVGAEVAYFRGIGRCQDLRRLCIVGTNVILIEMPLKPWSDVTLEDLYAIQSHLGLIPIVAHIERYPEMRKSSLRRDMIERGILLQTNVSTLSAYATRCHTLHMLKKGEVQLLGSDCHNMTTRPPGLMQALQRIQRGSDEEFVLQMAEFNYFVLRGATPIEKIHSI